MASNLDPSALQPPEPRRPGGTNAVVILFALVGVGALLVVGGLVAWGVAQGIQQTREAAVASAAPSVTGTKPKLPPVERHVPKHPLSILDGCSEDDVRAVATGIASAIDVGAPLYNAGNFAGCYHMYEGTAADVGRKLGDRCPGPARALEAGRERAASLETPSAQAWAMRDAFDGLIDVISRHEAK